MDQLIGGGGPDFVEDDLMMGGAGDPYLPPNNMPGG